MARSPLERVLAEPTDLETIKVYGDWLLARDDPQGEAIQLACQLETLSAFEPRRRTVERRLEALVETHERTWCAELAATTPVASRRVGERVQLGLIRGLPAHLDGRVKHLAEMLDAAAAVAPIVSLRPLYPRQGELAAFARTTAFARIARLSLDTLMERTEEDVEKLFDAMTMPALERLALNRAGTRTLAALARSGRMAALTHLDLIGDGATVADLAPVLAGTRLVSLSLRRIPLGREGIAMIAEHCPALRTLVVESCAIDTKALELLAGSPAFAGVETLKLGGNPHKPAGVVALAASKSLAKVTRLSLRRETGDSPPVGLKVLEAFLGALRWKQLRGLDLARCNVRAEGAAVLAAAKVLAKLEELDLEGNALGDAGVAALAKSKTLTALRAVDLAANSITVKGMEALAEARWLATVEELTLRHNKFGSGGGKALADSKFLNVLRVLRLGHNWLGDQGIRALLERAETTLERVDSGLNNYGNEVFAALVESEQLALTRLTLAAPTADDYQRLAASPRVASLRRLQIFPSGALDVETATALAASPHLAGLGALEIGSGNPEAAPILEQRFGPRVVFV